MSQTTSSIAILIPAYNEEAGIAATLRKVLDVRGDNPWQVIVVDDHSTDRTPEILKEFAGRIRVIRHSGNLGYGASLKTGIRATRAENVIFLDADGQHDPAFIPAVVEKLAEHEFVIGTRVRQEGVPLVRLPGKFVIQSVVSFLVGHKVPDVNFGFRGGRRRLYLRMLDLLPNGFSFTTTSLVYILKSRLGAHFMTMPAAPRQGKSSVRIVRDGLRTLLLALRLVTLFDPIRTFGTPAVGLIALGLAYQVFIFAKFGLHIEGGAILSILAGIILFHFALLCDQIAALRRELSSHSNLIAEHLEKRDGDA